MIYLDGYGSTDVGDEDTTVPARPLRERPSGTLAGDAICPTPPIALNTSPVLGRAPNHRCRDRPTGPKRNFLRLVLTVAVGRLDRERGIVGVADEARSRRPRRVDIARPAATTLQLRLKKLGGDHRSGRLLAKHLKISDAAPMLLMRSGLSERRTRDYVRHGTTARRRTLPAGK